MLPLYDALYAEPRLRHVLVRHEQAAVHAAEGYARSTGRTGVVFVTSGPGMANTTSGLLDAMCDSIPVLCISGQVATAAIGTDAFQECDAIGISRSVTKWNTGPRGGRRGRRGEPRLRTDTPGPARPGAVGFPQDVQLAVPHDADIDVPAAPSQQKLAARARRPASWPLLPQSAVRRAAALIAQAKHPIFYGGGGLVNAGPACAAFTELVRHTGAPCTLTLMGLGAFPASSPQFVGMLGMHGTVEANLAMHNADLVVCIGARFDDRITGKLSEFCPHARKIHIDIDPASINKVVRVDVALVGVCRWCRRCAPSWATRRWTGAARALVGPHRYLARRDCLGYTPSAESILPQHLMARLNAALDGRDAVVSTDVGQHQMWAAQYLRFDRPNRWLTSAAPAPWATACPPSSARRSRTRTRPWSASAATRPC